MILEKSEEPVKQKALEITRHGESQDAEAATSTAFDQYTIHTHLCLIHDYLGVASSCIALHHRDYL